MPLVLDLALDKEEVGDVLAMEAQSPPATPRHQGLWGRLGQGSVGQVRPPKRPGVAGVAGAAADKKPTVANNADKKQISRSNPIM